MKKIAALAIGAALAIPCVFPRPAFATLTDTSDGRIISTGNGVKTVFPFTFPVTAKTDVQTTVVLSGVTQNIGATITINVDQIGTPGGNVTFATAPPNTSTVTIFRKQALTQTAVLNAYPPAKTMEKTLDAVVMKIQQIDRDRTDLAVKEAADIAATIAGGTPALNLLQSTATGSSTGRLLADWFADSMNVKAFGANGDGITNNDTAFTAAAAWANAGVRRTLFFPDGNYVYTGGLVFTTPVSLVGGHGAILTYNGSGLAVKMGPDGLTVGTYQSDPYRIIGLTFTGGATMTNGVYFNTFVVSTLVRGTYFYNFGNSTAWDIFYQSSNWYDVVDGIDISANGGFARVTNGIRVNGYDISNNTDFGQSRLVLTNSIIQPFSAQGGIGLYSQSFHGIISGTTFSSFATEVQLGSWANETRIEHSYFEQSNSANPVVMYGDSSGARTSIFLTGVTVNDCYFNVHNLDSGGTSHVLGPATASAGIMGSRFTNNTVVSLAAGQPLIVLNNTTGQVYNFAERNLWSDAGGLFYPVALRTGGSNLHNSGANISLWEGAEEVLTSRNGLSVQGVYSGLNIAAFNNLTDAQGVIALQVGRTAQQYGLYGVYDYQGNLLGGFQCSGVGLANSCNIIGPGGHTGVSVDQNGFTNVSAFTFANLGTPVNGSVAYCSNCTIANPCAAGGTGALAKRINNTWICN